MVDISGSERGRRKIALDAIPDEERARLDTVREYRILDTASDGAFDKITALAAKLFNVPIAIVRIVDHDRIWFKSRHGIEDEQLERDPGLCASGILQDEVWVVENASVDPRTLSNPLALGDFGLGFYAGAPLKTRSGHNLGTLCLLDVKPRAVSPAEDAILADLAGLVMHKMELRLDTRRTKEALRAPEISGPVPARSLHETAQ
nr:GAF domain-containing protein [Arthrobacter polaris]